MKMANDDYCCQQDLTLAQILAHMEEHDIEVIAVLEGANGTALVGIITRTGLKNAMTALNFNAELVTAKEILATLPKKRI